MDRRNISRAEPLIIRLLTQIEHLPERLWRHIVRFWVNYQGRLHWRNREEPPKFRDTMPVKLGPWFLEKLDGRWYMPDYDDDDDVPNYR